MKSYTDLEQSKKLSEILPLESADAFYMMGDEPVDIAVIYGFVTHKHLKEQVAYKRAVPCWSLSALLSLIPIEHNLHDYLTENGMEYRIETLYAGNGRSCENPIDACVSMIFKLKELEML